MNSKYEICKHCLIINCCSDKCEKWHDLYRKQIEKVTNEIPLTEVGAWWNDEDEEFQRNKNALLNKTEIFVKICDWLETVNIKKIKGINTSSYYIKHIVEEVIGGYVSNGILIAAAIHYGFKYKLYDKNPNVNFNMSKRSIKNITKDLNLVV
jgi:hypothetical protein